MRNCNEGRKRTAELIKTLPSTVMLLWDETVTSVRGASRTAAKPNSETLAISTLGALQLDLHSGSYDWKFIPVGKTTFADTGSESCN